MIDLRANQTSAFSLPQLLAVVVAAIAIDLAGLAGGAEPLAGAHTTGAGRLDLLNGGFVVGKLQASDQQESIRWQADGFTEPLDFALDAVRHISFEPEGGRSLRDRSEPETTPTKVVDRSADRTEPEEPPTGGAVGHAEFACALINGATLYGRLVGLTAEEVVLQTASDQQLRIQRQQVARLVRAVPELRGGRRTSMNEPGRSSPWQFDLTGKPWEPGVETLEHAGVGTPSGSGEFIDLDLASQCMLELDVAWRGEPQFELAFGIAHTHESLQQAIRLAVWEGELVLVRELDSQLHLAVVLAADELSTLDQLQLRIYLDLAASRVVVRQQSGELLADFSAPAANLTRGLGVRSFVGNSTQVVHLAATSLSWGNLPGSGHGSDTAHVVLRTGDAIEGLIEQLDVESQQISLKQPDRTRPIALGDIQQLVLIAAVELQAAAGVADEQPSAPLYQIFTTDGWNFQGRWLGVDGDHLRMQVTGIDEPVAVPLRRLESISSLRRAAASGSLKPSRTGQLIAEGIQLRGKIVSSDTDAAEPQLRWHPEGSLNSAPLRLPVNGEIVYRSVRPPLEAVAGTREVHVVQGGLGGALLQLFGGPAQPVRRVQVAAPQLEVVKGGRPAAPAARSQATLFLRTGDTITCDIQKIDERGIHFSSPAVEQGFARHDQVKTAILAGLIQPKQISEATRERLLMVPRSRRDDPPTHLICSRTGDFLRGRLISLDEESLRLETRLETREIPRDRVAQIFWMHPQPGDEQPTGTQDGAAQTQEDVAEAPSDVAVADSLAEVSQPADTQTSNVPSLRMQALRLDGTRMTFDFLACRDDSMIVGDSDLLGECQIDVLQLDRLLLGSAVDRSADDSPLARWRLHDAPIPKAFLPGAGGSDGGASGTESTLVGKPAPQFELELLSGEKFRLADSRGRVIVLDFWASWCGPCIQAMPQIDQVVSDFPQADVQLVVVNLQEPAATITAALERMGLEVTVALDRNGSVAEQYGVTAIPQTVIIGPSGDVARLYVGINSSSAGDMHAAITELLQQDADESAAIGTE